MYPILPQHDPEITERSDQIAALRHKYSYDYDTIPGCAMARDVPFQNEFAFELLMEVASRQTVVMINSRFAPRDRQHDEDHGSLWDRTTEFIEKLQDQAESFLPHKVGDLLHQFFDSTRKRYSYSDSTELDQFQHIFREIKAPPISQNYQEDHMFAQMRLAGPNPMMLVRVHRDSGSDLSSAFKELFGKRFPLTNEQFQAVAGAGDSLEKAADEGRLYLADYRALKNLRTGQFKGRPKYAAAPLALFYIPLREDGSRGNLMPVAIQCGQTPGMSTPMIQPHHGHAWLMARNLVQVADGNLHQAVMHLGRTHIFLEPFVIATLRHLSPRHPLYILLDAHFEGTLAINSAAHKTLLAPDGVVDHILAGTLEASVGLAVDDLKTYSANAVLDPRELFAKRGVEDAELLPEFAYRDDALPVWDAIRAWVDEYIDLYYHSDACVQKDTELRTWSAELVAHDGGRVPGFGQDANGTPVKGNAEAGPQNTGRIMTRDYLKQVVAMLLFKAGPEHAAVNFPQKDLMSYVPNMPLAAYAPPPTATEGVSEADYVAMLPPIDAAYMQLDTGYLLGGVHHTRLGQYGTRHFRDPRVAEPLQRFQARLEEIESAIAERNQHRFVDYYYLLPSQIPQSVNI